jgi:hypothetical protein
MLGLVPAMLSGCVGPERVDLVPLGTWTGQGVFTYNEWGAGSTNNSQEQTPRTIHREYPTHLRIEAVHNGGSEFILIEIVSERGPLPGPAPDMGDATHILLALAKAKTVSDSAVLFYGIDAHFNPEPDESLGLRPPEDSDEITGSCLRRGDVTVLRLQYEENFCDTLRFRGGTVEKEGAYYDHEEGVIHWSESLRRVEM